MKKMTSLFALFALGTGMAVAGGEKEADKFDALDDNDDGYITMEEAENEEGLSGSFADADSDHDGQLSADEYSDYLSANTELEGEIEVPEEPEEEY